MSDANLFANLNAMGQLFNELATAKGFHENDRGLPKIARIGIYINNFNSESAELWEAARAGRLDSPCDKATAMEAIGLPPLTCQEEELAYKFIRVLESAYELGVDMNKSVAAKHAYNMTRPHRHGGKLV